MCVATAGAAGEDGDCRVAQRDELVQVAHVYAGETLVLRDGRRLQLIGIDAPDMAHDGQSAEPSAIDARNFLRKLLFTHKRQLELHFDRVREDPSGLRFAHAFLPDGTNIAGRMLREGQARLLIVPPNERMASCYQAAMAEARANRRGIWAHDYYQPLLSVELSPRIHGNRIVRGRVIRVSRDRHSTRLDLEGRFAVHVETQDLKYFDDWGFRKLVGREVEAQGQIHQRKGQLRMQVRHPSALRRLAVSLDVQALQ